jgi:enamine deaminase RidA (YjgF/YER057c/UK114 family)
MPVTYLRRPEGLGEPLGRYSHVSVTDARALVHVAGQVGMLSDGELAGDGSFGAQVRQAFINLSIALRAGGAEMRDLVKTTTFIVGAEHIEEFMRVRGEVFAELLPDGECPPNTILVISRLVEPELLFEVEGVAAIASINGGGHA